MSDFKTQRNRLLQFFANRAGQWVKLPEILALGIAQYNARIKELRDAGYEIECRVENVGRSRHSFYMFKPRLFT